MTTQSTTVWEFRPTNGGADFGGGYDSGISGAGTDYTQQDAVQAVWTNLSTAGIGSTAVTDDSASGLFTSAMIGNCFYNDGTGTNTVAGYYFVISVADSNNCTIDKAMDDGGGGASNCPAKLGGAIDILTDAFFDSVNGGFSTSNQAFLKNDGTMTLTGSIDLHTVDGTDTARCKIIGYDTSRTVVPLGDNRPLIACGSSFILFDNGFNIENLRGIGTNSLAVFRGDARVKFVNCDAVNESTSANRVALYVAGSEGQAVYCSGASLKGYAFRIGGTGRVINCHAANSSIGFFFSGSDYIKLERCVADSCREGIGANTGNSTVQTITGVVIINCTTGIHVGGGGHSWHVSNSILTDCVEGLNLQDAQDGWYLDYNHWNNTTDVTNISKGPNSVTGDPGLTATLSKGTDGTTESSDQTDFRSASAPFSGVTTSDHLIIHSGTGVTVGVYEITAVASTSRVAISTGATTSASSCTFGIVKGADFTLKSGSTAIDAGLKLSTNIGVEGTYKQNIGVDQTDYSTVLTSTGRQWMLAGAGAMSQEEAAAAAAGGSIRLINGGLIS